MPECSVDSIVTDPPYEIGFMGKSHDSTGIAYSVEMWAECLRVLKPGGHLLAFGGTRTYHRMTCAIEDAGFQIRDSITWLYGSGFPKSLDVSKAIDKAAGAEREVTRPRTYAVVADQDAYGSGINTSKPRSESCEVTAPATDDAKTWDGWGTALKPASESIVVARKPLQGNTVAANVLAHGTGAINVDGCRVGTDEDTRRNARGGENGLNGEATFKIRERFASDKEQPSGRWPANVVLSHAATAEGDDACAGGCVEGCPVSELDGQSGVRPGGNYPAASDGIKSSPGLASGTMGGGWSGITRPVAVKTESGGASRFFPVFRYQAKAPTRERPKVDGVAHATVKPLALIRWLVTLVTAPGGTVLDPFAGSGTTVEASIMDGFSCIAVEMEPSYLPLINARIARATR
jgi:site-specific DNA-methyltransferase (adenine-specific)